MNKDEFMKLAKSGGYATMPIIRKYIKINGDREYTDEDLITVHRNDIKRYDLAHKESENNKTTKNYIVYNSQQTGGSY